MIERINNIEDVRSVSYFNHIGRHDLHSYDNDYFDHHGRDRDRDRDECCCKNNSCGGDDSVTLCTKGRGILFGVTMGDRVLIRVKSSSKELCVVFQGIADDIVLFTNGDAGSGLLRVPLKNIISVRMK